MLVNSRMARNKRARSWCFTWNNPTAEEIKEFWDWYTRAGEHSGLTEICKYFILGFETAPSTGTFHIQGYIQFSRPHSPIPCPFRIHWEICKGNPTQNITYCQKDGEYYEYGEPPTEGGRLTMQQLEAVMEDPENNVHLYHTYKKTYVELLNKRELSADYKTTFYYHCSERDRWFFTTIYDQFPDEKMIVVNHLSELALYPSGSYDGIVWAPERHYDELQNIYMMSMGKPIAYKHGYEYVVVKPHIFVVYVPISPALFKMEKDMRSAFCMYNKI